MTPRQTADLPRVIIGRYSQIGSATRNDCVFGQRTEVSAEHYREALVASASKPGRKALYVHLPFCPVRCLDCNSNTVVTHNRKHIDDYLDHLSRELDLLTRATGPRIELQQLHLGGGSPNYLSESQLLRLMGMIDDAFVRDEQTFGSLSANPRRTSPSQLALLTALGFDSISFGLRDLDLSVQAALGRRTSFSTLADVFQLARDTGFATVGTDILYGVPCQTTDGIRRTVDRLLELSPDHIACNAFNRHANERPHQSAIDQCRVPSLADKLAQFNCIVQLLSHDYEWIGLDNFAKPGHVLAEAQAENRLSKNWIGYSHMPATDLYGIGTNAISDVEGICVQNQLEIDPWQSALLQNELPIRGGLSLTDEDRRYRHEIQHLVCNGELGDDAQLFDHLEDPSSSWSHFVRDGLLTVTSDKVRLSDQGRFLLPHLLQEESSRLTLAM
jgi:oxygen-independent coproporphyrinogen-3 oxidase